MLVAIPSVTSYINNSRKSAYADTAANYIKGATNLVNEGVKVQAYSEDVLYMIPAGHNKELSCVALESGGQSPYNTMYKMAYVGVTYDNSKGSYNYYFTAVDGSGQGFKFTSSYKISSSKSGEGSALVEAGLGNYAAKLQAQYSTINGTEQTAGANTDAVFCTASGDGCTQVITDSDATTKDEKDIMTAANRSTMIVYAATTCQTDK
jgi:hypothetical protein